MFSSPGLRSDLCDHLIRPAISYSQKITEQEGNSQLCDLLLYIVFDIIALVYQLFMSSMNASICTYMMCMLKRNNILHT